MSAELFRILTCGDPVEPWRRRRQWLDVGRFMVVAGVALMPVAARGDEPALQIYSRQGEHLGAAPLAPMTFSCQAPYAVIPRAVRLAGNTVISVLIETQYTGDGQPGWIPQEDRCNEKLQPISDAG